MENEILIAELYQALLAAQQELQNAKKYYPKSIKNSDTFSLLNTLANAVETAIAKAQKYHLRNCAK